MSQLSLLQEPTPRAVFSACSAHASCDLDCLHRHYRYELEWPTGNPRGEGMVLFCLANPSKATHLKTDRTVARAIDYGLRWGFAWTGICNARAWRETDSDLVPLDPLAIGPENDRHVFEMAVRAKLVVCGWGKLGGAQGPRMLEIIREAGKVPHALYLNKDGSPQHPLYLDATLRPVPIPERRLR